ncbi:MAG: cell division transport system permease protein [Gaiellaceae bacterium]|nr:cell division transport system permease protein [Gaiellaceae bacterium]
MTVLIGMFLLGLFIAFGTWVVSWSNHVKRELVVHVYYCTSDTCAKEASTKQMNAVANIASSSSLVKTVVPVSKEQALAQMKKKHPEEVKALPNNPFPNALTVIPKRGEDVEKVAALFTASPAVGIDKVDYGKQTTHRVLKLAHVIEIFFVIAVALLLMASTLLIANTIRLSIFSRRREIVVMKLVGATNWFVRGPFMLEGLLCGVAGAVGAVLLLIIGKEIALPSLLHSGPLKAGTDVNAIGFTLNALILVGTGLLLGAAGSGFTIRRFLKV